MRLSLRTVAPTAERWLKERFPRCTKATLVPYSLLPGVKYPADPVGFYQSDKLELSFYANKEHLACRIVDLRNWNFQWFLVQADTRST